MGVISYCYSTANVKGNNIVGGLVGSNGHTINNCYATGNVSGGNSVGGLVGSGGNINNSYATGNVSGEIYVEREEEEIPRPFNIGGLVGNNANINNSYATGNVSGRNNVGGLVGEDANINNCYATGNVTGTGSFVGGLIGRLSGDGDGERYVVNSYYNSETSGQSDTGKGSRRTTAQMKQKSTFVDWNFDEAQGWKIEEGVSYPYLSYVFPSTQYFIYDGSEKRFSTLEFVSGQDRFLLKENVDYTASFSNNINAGTATATINGIGKYSFISNMKVSFQIIRRNVYVIWGSPVLEWHGEPQAPTAVSNDERFPVKVTGEYGTELGYYGQVKAELVSPNTNIVLFNTILADYEIVKRNISVKWEDTILVYNKMPQAPKATTLTIDKIGEVQFTVTVAQNSEVGVYTASAQISNERIRNNSVLTNYTINYEIVKRPLEIIMTDENGERIDSLVVDKNLIDNETALFEYIESIIDYIGFARDTISGETDDKSVLSGELAFEFERVNVRSIDRGDYIIIVKTDGISAKNYFVEEREIRVSVGDDSISIATPINNIKNSDNRHGIRFAVNPVSDKAEIAVILPNNERAVEVSVVIYDMAGNVVFERRGDYQSPANNAIIWDLRNQNGRFVANGTYLVIAEARDRNGRVYRYSARLGVKR